MGTVDGWSYNILIYPICVSLEDSGSGGIRGRRWIRVPQAGAGLFRGSYRLYEVYIIQGSSGIFYLHRIVAADA